MAVPDTTVGDAISAQARACGAMGSTLWARVLAAMALDHQRGGLTASILDGRSERPVHDAIVLRLLGAVHRIALRGDAPALAACLPSCGGDASIDPVPPFFATAEAHRAEVHAGIDRPVQTNEVGRAAALVGGFVEAARRGGRRPLRTREVGASAGLLMNWDRFHYITADGAFGPPDSPVMLRDNWRRPPRFDAEVCVIDRRGCDTDPIDATSPDGELTLTSFVWPDQLDRLARLRAAIEVARRFPPTVDRVDAGEWVEHALSDTVDGAVTVVYHSIVLQYLPRESHERLRHAIARAGAHATEERPLAWLRMEPAGRHADVRLSWWPGSTETVLATTGFHGRDVDWR